ncbi:hypothetical protein Tco_0912259 [Tanacetum coccineum]
MRENQTTCSGHVSSSTLLRTVAPTGRVVTVQSGSDEENEETHNAPKGDHNSDRHSPCESTNESVHNYVNVDGGNDKESPPWLEPFINQLGKPLNADKEEVFFLLSLHAEDGESSRSGEIYVPEWGIPWRYRVDSPMWCRKLMVHLAPPAAQEESNALPNPIALERVWFSLARGTMAQADILERFENLQDDYTRLVETHDECSETVMKLVTARQDLEHNAKLYTDMADRYKGLKEEHTGCGDKFKNLEKESNEMSVSDKKLVAQLSQTEFEKFDCIRKLLPTMVSRLFQSHEYKQSLSEPFCMAIQAVWCRGLSEGRTKEHILAALHVVEGFDAYSDKKLYPMYDKLFEKEYPYVMKIASGYRHSVADLLKIHPDLAPSERSVAPVTSTTLGRPPYLDNKA